MEGNGLYGLVHACYRLGDIRRSVEYCEQVLHVFEAIGHPNVEHVRELLPILRFHDKISAEF
jgi:hypothetical protein